MQYEDALREWGARRIEQQKTGVTINRATVTVEMDFDEGVPCGCGGRDPNCYCALAESPSAKVEIRGTDRGGAPIRAEISHYSFDFATVLREIPEAGDGTITGPADGDARS